MYRTVHSVKALPTTAKGLRTRAAIVSAAARLMHDRGLAGPSTDEILAASGTGKSQLYRYFDDKHDLAVAVLRHQFELVMGAQPALHDPSCADLGRWRAEVLAAHRSSGLGNCPLGAFVSQTDHDPELRATLVELFTRWQSLLADLVDRARAAGHVRADVDPALAGRALLAALQGGTILAHLHVDPDPLVQSLTDAITTLMKENA
jgi:AcrR family transcriptional regulator